MSLSCFRINTYTSVDSTGLTAVYCFGAFLPRIAYGARFEKRPIQPHTKRKMRQLGCRSGDFTWLFPRMIIPNFGLGSREKKNRQCPNLTRGRSCCIKESKGEICGRKRENELDWQASAGVAGR